MIVGYIKGQSLSLSSPTIASGTIDHLTAFFTFFTSEWEQCNEIWVHFSQGDTVYDAEIVEGKVEKNQHINLDKGEWEVYVHGNVTANGEVVERITTEKETLYVKESGIVDGTPFPSVEESTAEKILAKAQFAVDEIGRLEDKIEESAISPEQEAQIQSNTAMIEDILLNGRNLLKNGDLSSREGWLTSGLSLKFDNGYMEISKAETSGRANFYQSASQNPLLNKSENAEMYTVSIEVMKISGVEIPANSSFEIHFGGTTKRLIANIPTDLNEGVWTKIKATTPTNFEPSGNMVARIFVGKNAGGFACRNAKLESWTTALEFLNEKIDDMPTGGGLTPEQEAEIQANTAARHTHNNYWSLSDLHCEASEIQQGGNNPFPILPDYVGVDRPTFKGNYLSYCSDGAVIGKVEEKDDGEKFLRLWLYKGPSDYNFDVPDFIDIPVKAINEKVEDFPSIGTNGAGVEVEFPTGGDFVTTAEMETYVTAAINGSLDELEAMIDESGVLTE